MYMKRKTGKTAMFELAALYRCMGFVALACVMYMASDTPAYASLCTALGWFKSNFAAGIESAGIIMLGVMATVGRISATTAITVAVGIAIINGYSNILTGFGATSC